MYRCDAWPRPRNVQGRRFGWEILPFEALPHGVMPQERPLAVHGAEHPEGLEICVQHTHQSAFGLSTVTASCSCAVSRVYTEEYAVPA